MNCESCAQRVRLYSGSEGTSSYEGVDAEEAQLWKEKAIAAQEEIVRLKAKLSSKGSSIAIKNLHAIIRQLEQEKYDLTKQFGMVISEMIPKRPSG